MTRHDVANLVIRIFALWLVVTGVATIASVPFLTSLPGFPALLFTSVALFLPFPAGVALWYLAPRLAGTVFDRSGEVVPHAITPATVPPLACFVVGLVVLAGAVPSAASWLTMQVMRSRLDPSLANPNVLLPFDLRSAGTAADAVARLIAGAVLVAISRRRDIWSAPGSAVEAAAAPDE